MGTQFRKRNLTFTRLHTDACQLSQPLLRFPRMPHFAELNGPIALKHLALRKGMWQDLVLVTVDLSKEAEEERIMACLAYRSLQGSLQGEEPLIVSKNLVEFCIGIIMQPGANRACIRWECGLRLWKEGIDGGCQFIIAAGIVYDKG